MQLFLPLANMKVPFLSTQKSFTFFFFIALYVGTVKPVQTTHLTIQLLLYKTATCLTRPTTTFFVSQMKRKPVKNNYYKTLPCKEMVGNKHKAKIHKRINVSVIIFTLLLLYNAKFV